MTMTCLQTFTFSYYNIHHNIISKIIINDMSHVCYYITVKSTNSTRKGYYYYILFIDTYIYRERDDDDLVIKCDGFV